MRRGDDAGAEARCEVKIIELAAQHRDIRARKAARWFRAQGHDVMHVAGWENIEENCVLREVEPLDGITTMRANTRALHQLQATILALEPDVVHCHALESLWHYLAAGACTEQVMRRFHDGAELVDCGLKINKGRAKIIYDAHEFERDRAFPWLRRRAAHEWSQKEHISARYADAIVTVSDELCEALEEEYFPQVAACVAPNAPPLPKREPCRLVARDALKVEKSDRLIAFAGYATPDRAIDDLLSAMIYLRKDDPAHRWRLVCFGTSRDAPLRRRMTLAGAEFFGDVPYPWPEEQGLTLIDYLSACNVGFCGAWPEWKNWAWSEPNKLYEYALAGIPQVGTAGMITFERLAMQYGLGTTYANVLDLAAQLRELAEWPRLYDGPVAESPIAERCFERLAGPVYSRVLEEVCR